MYVDRFRFPCLFLTSLSKQFSHTRPCLQLSLLCRPLNRSVLAIAVWFISHLSSRNFLTQRPRSTKGRSHKFAVIQETIHELRSLESVQHRRPWIIVEHEILLNTDLNVDLWKWCGADTNLLSALSLPSTQQPVENRLSRARTRRRQRLCTKRGQQAVAWNWST